MKKEYAELQAMLTIMLQELKVVYSNKSSDEYKHAGDITRSPEYKRIEERVSDLATLNGFNKNNIAEIKTLFQTLHRPIFKQMVSEYLKEPNEQNIFYTALYTCGYRVLVGELARIFASTVIADKKSITYKPDKISREQSMDRFIKMFNIELDKAINEFIKIRKQTEIMQEGAASDAFGAIWQDLKKYSAKGVKTLVKLGVGIFTGRFNPISFIGTALSTGFTMKVRKFDEVCTHYEEAKNALEQYQKLPAHKQDAKIIDNYNKLIDKYNIKMGNIKAKIDHYDQRAITEAEAKLTTKKKTIETKTPNKPAGSDNSSGNDDIDF